jgi:hypothetical protein
MARSIGVMSAAAVADETLAGIERGQFMIIPGRNARVMTTLARAFPSLRVPARAGAQYECSR